MELKFFLAVFFIIVLFMIVIPVGVTMRLHHKYGPRLPGKGAAAFILCIVGYYTLFFTYAGDMIPESWRPEAKQVYQCEWKTVYVEKQP